MRSKIDPISTPIKWGPLERNRCFWEPIFTLNGKRVQIGQVIAHASIWLSEDAYCMRSPHAYGERVCILHTLCALDWRRLLLRCAATKLLILARRFTRWISYMFRSLRCLLGSQMVILARKWSTLWHPVEKLIFSDFLDFLMIFCNLLKLFLISTDFLRFSVRFLWFSSNFLECL